MKLSLHHVSALAVLLVVAGCSTPTKRIGAHQTNFDTWPAAVQEKVRAGQVDVGFTEEMVQVALGDPDNRSTRTTVHGTSEVWGYLDHKPKFSLGVGMGTSRGNTGYGGGVVVGDNGLPADIVMQVVFQAGRVVAIESRHN
jgi:hypothetical protein